MPDRRLDAAASLRGRRFAVVRHDVSFFVEMKLALTAEAVSQRTLQFQEAHSERTILVRVF